MNNRVRKILVVDDDSTTRIVLSDLLASLGYKVVVEGRALCAIRSIVREEPDLVLLDLKMPGADGMQILRTLKRKCIRIPVIIISGYIGDQEIRELLDLGIRHIMAKPVPWDILERKLDKVFYQNF